VHLRPDVLLLHLDHVEIGARIPQGALFPSASSTPTFVSFNLTQRQDDQEVLPAHACCPVIRPEHRGGDKCRQDFTLHVM